MNYSNCLLLLVITPLFGCSTASTTSQKKPGDFPSPTSSPSPTTQNNYYPKPTIQPNSKLGNNGFKYPPVPQSNGNNFVPSGSTPQNPTPSTTPPVKQLGSNAAESTDFDMTNGYRSQAGLSALQLDSQMSEVARNWSVIQHDRGSIGHDGFESRSAQLNLGNAGENVAMNGGFGNATDSTMGKMLSEQWRNSPEHYQNMIGSQFRRIGIGIYCGQNGCYGTQIFGD